MDGSSGGADPETEGRLGPLADLATVWLFLLGAGSWNLESRAECRRERIWPSWVARAKRSLTRCNR